MTKTTLAKRQAILSKRTIPESSDCLSHRLITAIAHNRLVKQRVEIRKITGPNCLDLRVGVTIAYNVATKEVTY